jgi:hypothetical protein
MPIDVFNPYSGQSDETCSVSFAAQQQMAGSVGSAQTEAEFNQSKLLGEWGVISAKLNKGEIPDGTKVLTYTNATAGSRGYIYVKGGKLFGRRYDKTGATKEFQVTDTTAPNFIKSQLYSVAIPQAVAAKPKPEPVVIKFGEGKYVSALKASLKDGDIVATQGKGGDYIQFEQGSNAFALYQSTEYGYVKSGGSPFLSSVMKTDQTWYAPDGKDTTTNANPATATPPPAPTQVAAPTPVAPVNAGSASVGSMSHEDVAAMFVKIKDDLAKEKGLNIKGANADLDQEVFAAIGKATGYTSAEVKAKIDAYKAAGNKLSALKKKVLAGTKKVPTGNGPQSASTGPKPLVPNVAPPPTNLKPNGVPTVATPAVTNAVKQEVADAVAADPTKVYSDEDVAGAYIIAKDKIVAGSSGKWTLYSKSDEMDLEIAIQVGMKTGLNPTQQKVAIANYLASGKKLSTLKKQLVKQGAFKPQADTLKKSGAAKTQAEKDAEVAAHAAAGYTPTPTPTVTAPKPSGSSTAPPMDTGNAMPHAPAKAARLVGDIGDLATAVKADAYKEFKALGQYSYLTASNETTYDGLVKLQATMAAKGHDLSLLQLLRVIDEEGAKKFGVENTNLFEKKTASWLTSPAGTAHVKANEAKAAKAAEAAKQAVEIAKAAKLLEANQPPLPADSAQYQPWELEKAKRVSRTWLEAKPWTDKEQRDLKHYTGSAYSEMNSYLRGRSTDIGSRSKSAIAGARAGMRPTTEPIMVRRGTGLAQFSSLGLQGGDKHLVWGLAGKKFVDEGFLSTSAGGRAAFSGDARLEIECPVGTPMAYVAPISNFPGENEMLLQAGMEYTVLNVRTEDGQIIIRMRVTGWPGKGN